MPTAGHACNRTWKISPSRVVLVNLGVVVHAGPTHINNQHQYLPFHTVADFSFANSINPFTLLLSMMSRLHAG